MTTEYQYDYKTFGDRSQVYKPVGYHIRNFKAEPPTGYEYAWKTLYRRGGEDTAELLKQHEEQGYLPVGYLDTKHGIPRSSDGFYADGDAVLCVRPSYIGEQERELINKHNREMLRGLPALERDINASLEQSPESYIYEGEDPEIWAPIMENMEANIAKLEAEEEAKEEFERTKGKMFRDAVNIICMLSQDYAVEFVDTYREQIKLMRAEELKEISND